MALAAQTPKAFEVASVIPNAQPRMIRYSYPANGGFRGTSTLDLLIAAAYEVSGFQVVGGPNWAKTEAFDIDARSGPATQAETNAMLRPLLAERFGLVVRKDPNFKVMKWVLKMARSDRRLGPGIRQLK